MIESSYAEPLTLSTFAEALHVSPYHLHHLFKRVTGQTPAERLLAQRLTVAKALLAEAEQSITEIAGAVGIPNMAYFSTVFQKQVGISPRAYRNSLRVNELKTEENRDVR